MKTLLITLFFTLSLWAQPIKIALLSAPGVIGKYSSSTYSVALATLFSRNVPFELISIDMKDESSSSILLALEKAKAQDVNALLAPLTVAGAQELVNSNPNLPIFIPTVHKRDIQSSDNAIVFGAIDYQEQIRKLQPHMTNAVATFYDDSPIGNNLNVFTSTVVKSSTPYPIDTQGANIVKYLGRPAAFGKKSVIVHLPIVKTSMLIAHLTFVGAHEHNILSTQMSFDPTLISLTQSKDRKNMIVANSIVAHVPSIYEMNALFNNDLTFDWINYTTSVGADHLISLLNNEQRQYQLSINDFQVIYPVELMSPKEFGFEPFSKK
jgi:hypothetical protein